MSHHARIEPECRTSAYIGDAARRHGYLPDEIPSVVELAVFLLTQMERSEPGLTGRIEITLSLPRSDRGQWEMAALREVTRAAVGDGMKSRPPGKKMRRAIAEHARLRPPITDPRLEDEGRERHARLEFLLLVAIASLEPRDRDMIAECFFDNMTVRDVAARTNTPRSTIGDRRKRAIRELKDRLEHLMAKYPHFKSEQ